MDPKYNSYPTKQPMTLLRAKNLITCIVVLVVVFGLIGLAQTYYNDHNFSIVSTNPVTANVPSQSPYFEITFNRPLVSTSAEVASNPNIISGAPSINGKTLDITLNNVMSPNKTYTITIVHLSAQNGLVMSNKSVSFVAKNVTWNNLPQGMQQKLLDRQRAGETFKVNPVFNYIPYNTLDYQITGTITDNKVALQIQLLIPPSDTGSAATAKAAQDQQEALAYLQSKGFNSSEFTITYQTLYENLSQGGQTPPSQL